MKGIHPHAKQIIQLWNEDMRVSEIARRLRISKGVVSSFAWRNRDACPMRKVKGQPSVAKPPVEKPAPIPPPPIVTREVNAAQHEWPTYTRLIPAGARDQGNVAFAPVTLRRTSMDEVAA